MVEKIRVEQFGEVMPHQSWAFNTHLAKHLEYFDEAYEGMGGQIGSLQHHRDRMEFAGLVSTDMLKTFENDPGIITELNTETTFACASLRADIKVVTQSNFSYGKSLAPTPSLN